MGVVKKNFLVGLLTLVCMLISPSLLLAELSKGKKDTIFIGQLKIQGSVIELAKGQQSDLPLWRVADALDNQFVSSLNGTRIFQIVERKRFKDIQEEQDFASVMVDPNDQAASQAMMMSGAKFAFLPQIDGFEDRSERVEHAAIGRASLNRKVFLSATVQVVDTTTGQLLPDSPSVQVEKSEAMTAVRPDMAVGSDQLLVELAKEMSRQLSQKLVGIIRPAKVLAVTGRQIMINRGTQAGFSNGIQVEVYATQKIVDEDSGEEFLNEIPVGQGRIVRSDGKKSFAMVSGDDFGIARGCVVRIVPQAAGMQQGMMGGGGNGQMTPGSSDKPLSWN